MAALLLKTLEVRGLRRPGVKLEPAEDLASDPGQSSAGVERSATLVLFEPYERFLLLREVFHHA